VNFHDEWTSGIMHVDPLKWTWCLCPSCRKPTIDIAVGNDRFRVYPRASARSVPVEVPAELAKDYSDASLLLAHSPPASAALSRRCLRDLLRSRAGTTKPYLADQIEEVLASGALPAELADTLGAVRYLGNFAAFPMKSETPGEIFDVEPHEAEWTLDVLEALFHFYFVAPAALKAKKDAMNAKLQKAQAQTVAAKF
jgi:hypothetical protein